MEDTNLFTLKIFNKIEKIYPKTNKRNSSALHKEAKKILQEIYPFDTIFEEVFLPKVKLYIDLMIWNRKLAIEINGPQHYEYIQHFFPSLLDWANAQKRDRQKIQILEENDFTVISLRYDESKLWKQQIQQSKH